MMTANLIGFAIGTEGMSYMWGQMIGSWEGATLSPLVHLSRTLILPRSFTGVKFMIVVFACLFVAVQVMFEYRSVPPQLAPLGAN